MMTASEIRSRFLEYFERNGHTIRPSSSLVPQDDPTLLFTNAGMVQFKRVFTGDEQPPYNRATTSQKCLRVSGKHNDLEEVGVTSRHHTFFEMLGNFSFGDYFKRDAIRFAWDLFTEELKIPKERLWATVHYTDDEAAQLWEEVAGLPPERIFRLGDKDNFWQMGETGPCGPCSEIHYDLRTEGRGTDVSVEEFIERGERGEFLELWNLVFMQYDRSADGTLTPLPAPSIDTGAGLERLTAVLQGVDSNYKSDLFTPLIDRAVTIVGIPYDYDSPQGVSYRVLADHSRTVAFLLADGVFPSNEGRGYVLRRVLRRAVRHAWLLGRREPTLVHVVDAVVETMGSAYPDLVARRDHLRRYTLDEEQRFLATIDSGMQRFDELAPALDEGEHARIKAGMRPPPVVDGVDAFRLYDTFGFPIDLTELIARERGYVVDEVGFQTALDEQRTRSRLDRKASGVGIEADTFAQGWIDLDPDAKQEFVGYNEYDTSTDVIAMRLDEGRAALQLRRNPFYVESGGQVSDHGVVQGKGWSMIVDDVRKVNGRTAVVGDVEGKLPQTSTPFPARAMVEAVARRDTQRNHTATHLLQAALRKILGEHVVQRGSLVAPDRLRFDFTHTRPMTPSEIRAVEDMVNDGIRLDADVQIGQSTYPEAVARGAMALFGEKYGDVVRVVTVPDLSIELCGGTHVRHTGDIGVFRIISESGVAAGIRRIEAVTGSVAYRRAVEQEDLLRSMSALLKTTPEGLVRRVEQLNDEIRDLRRQVEKARTEGSSDIVGQLISDARALDAGAKLVTKQIEVGTADELRILGDRLRNELKSGIAVLAVKQPDRMSLFAVVTDDLVAKGVQAGKIVREVAAVTGGSGGGKPHMAQGGVGDPARITDALAHVDSIVRDMMNNPSNAKAAAK
jgi:alanyl-tRNA synthetase